MIVLDRDLLCRYYLFVRIGVVVGRKMVVMELLVAMECLVVVVRGLVELSATASRSVLTDFVVVVF